MAVTALVVLFLMPPLVAVTLTENEQLLLAIRVKEFMLTRLLPGVAEIAAAQVPVKPLGEATTKPLGSGSPNETFSKSVRALGLLRLKVNTVFPPTGIVASAKALAMVGGATCEDAVTVSVAVLLEAPAPLSLAEIGPVVLLYTAEVEAVTSTEIKQEPLDEGSRRVGALALWIGLSPTAGPKSPPDKVIVPDPGVAVTVPSQLFDNWLGEATTSPAGNTSVN